MIPKGARAPALQDAVAVARSGAVGAAVEATLQREHVPEGQEGAEAPTPAAAGPLEGDLRGGAPELRDDSQEPPLPT